MSKKNSCKIISINVRGIRKSIKRSSIFTYLRDQKAVFYFLQETYSEPGDELFWKNEWGGEIYFSFSTINVILTINIITFNHKCNKSTNRKCNKL